MDSSMIQGAPVQYFGDQSYEIGLRPVRLSGKGDNDALAFANGIPLQKRRAIRLASFLAVLVIGAFVIAALVRGPA